MTFTKKELREYMRKLGSKGGSSTSEAKRRAAQENMKNINSRRQKATIPIVPANLDRRQTAIYLWLFGLTYKEIGKYLNVSGQRAQQLIKPQETVRLEMRKQARCKCQRCNKETLNGHVHHRNTAGRTPEDFNNPDNLVYLCGGCHRSEHHEKQNNNA